MIFIDKAKYKKCNGIYMIKQKSTGRIYIGQTGNSFIKRFWNHNWKLEHNIHDNKFLQNCWNKYGSEDFEFSVVEVIQDKSLLDYYEKYYILKFDTLNNGFNLTSGGEGKNNCPMSENAKKIVGTKNRINNTGKKASQETREKMRKSSRHLKMTEKHKSKLKAIHTGFKYNEESKNKMSKSHLGSKNKVSVIDEQTAYIIKTMLVNGNTASEVSKRLNIKYPIVKSILQEKCWNQIKVCGWKEFINTYNKNKKKLLDDNTVKIIKELLNKSENPKDIALKLNVSINCIYNIKSGRSYKDI